MTRKNKQMAPSPRKLLNGHGVRRISGFKPECLGIRLGTLWKLEEKVRVMAIVLSFGREVMRICACGPQSRRLDTEKIRFYDEMGSGTLEVLVKSLFLWEISMEIRGNVLRVLKVYTRGMVLGKEMQKEEDCCSFAMKENCAWQKLGFIRQTK